MADRRETRIVDLSHVISDGMMTYKGLPGPHICDFWTREGIRRQLRRRLDLPDRADRHGRQHRHLSRHARSIATPTARTWPSCRCQSLADLPAIVVRQPWESGIAIDAAHFEGLDVRGKAVLVHTGWDRHWRTDAYFGDHPFLTAEAADWLVANGAALVGIDSYNIDDTRVRDAAGAHARCSAPDIPICEHMTGLGSLPDERLPLLRGAAQGEGHGDLPGARLRRARLSERRFSQSGTIAPARSSTRRCSTARPSSG